MSTVSRDRLCVDQLSLGESNNRSPAVKIEKKMKRKNARCIEYGVELSSLLRFSATTVE